MQTLLLAIFMVVSIHFTFLNVLLAIGKKSVPALNIAFMSMGWTGVIIFLIKLWLNQITLV
jgi:hypothetical protein